MDNATGYPICLRERTSLPAGFFLSLETLVLASYLLFGRLALLQHRSLDGSKVLLASGSIPVTARNTAGREYRREKVTTIAFMMLLKITPGAMWATELRQDKKAPRGTWWITWTESGSVGLLALGAAGLAAWRERRGQATE